MTGQMATTPLRLNTFGDEADAPDVGAPILRRQAEVGGERLSDHVAVEHLDALAGLDELLLERVGQRGLARRRQTRQPDCRSLGYVAHSDSPTSATYGPVSS